MKIRNHRKNLAERYVNFITETSLLRAIALDTLDEETQKCATKQTTIFQTRCWKSYKLHVDNIEDVDLNVLTAIKYVRDERTVHSDNILLRKNRIV